MFSSYIKEFEHDLGIPRQKIAEGHTIGPARETLLRYHLKEQEKDYVDMKEIRVYVATWNVNGQSPNNNIFLEWLACEQNPPDIYAIGFQELDLSKEAYLFNDTKRGEEWREVALNSLHPGVHYKPIAIVRLVGMMLIVLCKYEIFSYINNVCVDTVGTGIMGKMGNKGGVGVRFDIHNTSMCFVNSHLAAHTEEVERRNQDYRDICSRMSFSRPRSCMIKDHDHIFWLGDLNYRISELSMTEVKERLLRGDLNSILLADQLGQEHAKRNVLAGFTEGDITFLPTYKYDPGTDRFDTSEKARAPAWCDRVFWRGDYIEQTTYRSHPEIRLSDHKPVSAVFRTKIKVVNLQKYRKVHEELLKRMDKLENEFLPQVTVDKTEIQFDEPVKFLESQLQYLIIANTGQVPVQFEFINKLDDKHFCQDWLRVTPHRGEIKPGEKCDICFEVELKRHVEKLYDILVLHLEGGKDVFITVCGVCDQSAFLTPLTQLCRLSVPIAHATSDNILQMKKGPILYSIPRELFLLVDFLYRHGLKYKNLFERRALTSELILVRNWLDSDASPPQPTQAHVVAEALLMFLLNTPEPVIPYEFHSQCVAVSANYTNCRQIINKLPLIEKNTFLYLCLFAQELLIYSHENGMDSKLLSSIYGDILLPTVNQELKPQESRSKATFIHHFIINDQSDLISDLIAHSR